MKCAFILAGLLMAGTLCHAGAAETIESSSMQSGPDPVLVVSTNDLERILQGATNLPCIDAAWKTYRKHTAFLDCKGDLKARFDLVGAFSTEYELLSKLAECLIDSKVRVRQQPDGTLLYVNREKDKFVIRVIHDECDPDHFQGVYFLMGEHSFFTMEALLHVESRPNRDGTIKYGAHIYGNSDSRILKFLFRFSRVKNYLTHEVNDVLSQFDVVYAQMIQSPRENMQKVLTFRDPNGSLYFSDSDIEMVQKFVDTLPDHPAAVPVSP